MNDNNSIGKTIQLIRVFSCSVDKSKCIEICVEEKQEPKTRQAA
jgi:hypothetical protein